jgi:hypothetical protein
MNQPVQQIEKLEEQLRQLKVQLARAEARRRLQASRQVRRDDTRRKLLIGAIVLAKIEQGVLAASDLQGWLNAALTRRDDRRLFDLDAPP